MDVKQGYARVRSSLGPIPVWRRRWLILRRASSKGPSRLDMWSDERSSRGGGYAHKTTLLINVTNVCRLSASVRPHAFAITFGSSEGRARSKWFACDSDMDADCWVKLLISECLLPTPGLAAGEPDVLAESARLELHEQFHVYLLPTPKLEVFGECLLQVTHENIYLWDVANTKLKLVAWPLTALRRYGSDPTKFTFEAGRHCATGEGMFVFHTLVGEKIYRKVHQSTLAIAEAHHKKRHQQSATAATTAVATPTPAAPATTTVPSADRSPYVTQLASIGQHS